MIRYIALLRGINISGKNKISMPDLKTALTEKGFADVKTYLNSGNVAFWSFDRKLYAKANWWKKTAAPGIGEMITIRTANTLRKIVEM